MNQPQSVNYLNTEAYDSSIGCNDHVTMHEEKFAQVRWNFKVYLVLKYLRLVLKKDKSFDPIIEDERDLHLPNQTCCECTKKFSLHFSVLKPFAIRQFPAL